MSAEYNLRYNIFTELKNLMLEFFAIKPEEVKPEASIVNDLGIDSLDIDELLIATEERFNIPIPDSVAEHLFTVGDIVEYIARFRLSTGTANP